MINTLKAENSNGEVLDTPLWVTGLHDIEMAKSRLKTHHYNINKGSMQKGKLYKVCYCHSSDQSQVGIK